ncbi:MAG: PAS domain S-box protein [Lachnospiraceae bacterium]|nr:PAS domain S-box protein [Lachnospiraceae bacterium]
MERNEELLMKHIIEDMSDGVIAIGFDSRILIHNRAAAKILGMDDVSLSGKSIAWIMERTEKNDELFELITDSIHTKSTVEKTVPFFHDDATLYLRVKTEILMNGNDKVGIVTVISDITERAELFIANKSLATQITNLMNSFVEVMVTAVEEKSPYNANHTKNMAKYGENYLKWLNDKGTLTEYTSAETSPLLMSIWLHDIGKLLVPQEVMDKPSRLGSSEKDILHRITTAQLMMKLKMLTESEKQAEWQEKTEALQSAKELILLANDAGFLDDDTICRLKEAARIECLTEDGDTIPLLNDDELGSITVVRGTLTDAERRIIESHVSLTAKLLTKMKFEGAYKSVPEWSGGHHELLDGSGYPKHLKADEIPWETRLITIIDIYDALTAEDRPYKPPMPPEKAFSILDDMAEHGKVDRQLLNSFRESGAWKKDGVE